MPSPQLQTDFLSAGSFFDTALPEDNIVHMLATKEEAFAVLQARDVAQPYLKWVEANTKDAEHLRSLQNHLDNKLDQLGCKNRTYPDENDAEEVYLLKAALKYTTYCANAEEPRSFKSWVIREGVVWERHDAKTQTLNKALHHAYTSASAKADGQRILSEQEAIRFTQMQSVHHNTPKVL